MPTAVEETPSTRKLVTERAGTRRVECEDATRTGLPRCSAPLTSVTTGVTEAPGRTFRKPDRSSVTSWASVPGLVCTTVARSSPRIAAVDAVSFTPTSRSPGRM